MDILASIIDHMMLCRYVLYVVVSWGNDVFKVHLCRQEKYSLD